MLKSRILKFSTLPTPPVLFRQFENGEISRDELQATMAMLARDLIEEMVETSKNPLVAYLERRRNQAAVKKLSRKHSPALLREVLSAMGEIADFPPAHLLWNASHRQMPLHCFVRMNHEPIFRVIKMDVSPMKVKVQVEWGQHRDKLTREMLLLQRNALLKLELVERVEML
jgi:hypothetical protein